MRRKVTALVKVKGAPYENFGFAIKVPGRRKERADMVPEMLTRLAASCARRASNRLWVLREIAYQENPTFGRQIDAVVDAYEQAQRKPCTMAVGDVFDVFDATIGATLAVGDIFCADED